MPDQPRSHQECLCQPLTRQVRDLDAKDHHALCTVRRIFVNASWKPSGLLVLLPYLRLLVVLSRDCQSISGSRPGFAAAHKLTGNVSDITCGPVHAYIWACIWLEVAYGRRKAQGRLESAAIRNMQWLINYESRTTTGLSLCSGAAAALKRPGAAASIYCVLQQKLPKHTRK